MFLIKITFLLISFLKKRGLKKPSLFLKTYSTTSHETNNIYFVLSILFKSLLITGKCITSLILIEPPYKLYIDNAPSII